MLLLDGVSGGRQERGRRLPPSLPPSSLPAKALQGLQSGCCPKRVFSSSCQQARTLLHSPGELEQESSGFSVSRPFPEECFWPLTGEAGPRRRETKSRAQLLASSRLLRGTPSWREAWYFGLPAGLLAHLGGQAEKENRTVPGSLRNDNSLSCNPFLPSLDHASTGPPQVS